MACCKNDLGAFPHNRVINTTVLALADGIHEIRLTGPNFATQSIWLDMAIGDEVTIPQGVLNEDFNYSMTVIQPDGTLLEVNDCSNFAFKTFINKIACSDESYL